MEWRFLHLIDHENVNLVETSNVLPQINLDNFEPQGM